MRHYSERGDLHDKSKMKTITDKNEALSAVRQDGLALKFVSDELRNDRELVKLAVKQDGKALAHASYSLRRDPELRRLASAD